jgi:hypothetical protein
MILLLASLAHADELPSMVNAVGSAIRWNAWPIPYQVNGANDAALSPDGAVFSVVSAASAWSDVSDTAVAFKFEGSTSSSVAEYDAVNGVFFLADWPLDPEMLAVTSVWTTNDGAAVGFDMQVNTADHAWSLEGAADAADLQNALTHEFGHALGIGHLDKSPEATMYPSAPDGETRKRDLSDDDRWVVMNFYPPAEEVLPGREALAGLSCNTVPGTSAGGFPVLLGLALTFVAARRGTLERA